jgi:hypothetical protein
VCPITIKPDHRPKEKHVQIAFILAILKERPNQLIEKIDFASTLKESFTALKQTLSVGRLNVL